MEKLNAIVWPATEKLVMEQVSKLHQQGSVKLLNFIYKYYMLSSVTSVVHLADLVFLLINCSLPIGSDTSE